MKKDIKKSIAISFKNGEFKVVDGVLYIIERDKDNSIIDETNFLEAIECLMGEEGINISIKKDNSLEE